MNVTGACHCGNIQYAADVDASQVVVCHCTDCQILSGGAFRVNVPVAVGAFNLTRGQPKTYVKIADSGAKRFQVFCPDCGTPLYSTAPVNPTLLFLRTGAIHQRESLRPVKQIWRRSTAAWLHELESLPGSPEQQALVAK